MRSLCHLVLIGCAVVAPADAQQAAAPSAVGVVRVERRPITETSEFLGRIQAIGRVNIQPRVTAFLTKRLFTEGTEVKKGDLLYQLEQEPFVADLQSKQASVKQVEAQLQNANLTLDRAQQLLKSAAGTLATFDTAQANQRSQEAQLLAAQAQLRQAEINLAYTEITAPIDGKIGQTSVTEGNVVSPNSGVLTTIVSQDPMYVVFAVPVRTVLEIRARISGEAGFDALKVKVRLPDGHIYGQLGKLEFLNNSVSGNTDTLTLRAVMPNPTVEGSRSDLGARRQLIDAELVTVLLEGAEPINMLTIPRAAVLTDQGGDYVYIVDSEGKAQRRSIKLDPSTTPTLAVLASGPDEGQQIIVEGLQRVRPGGAVLATPATPSPASEPRR
jgi:membrane fusion protein (multidrug efflux system)